MPELPDVVVYVEGLERRIADRRLSGIRLLSPFVLRSVRPAPDELRGKRVESLGRIGVELVRLGGGSQKADGSCVPVGLAGSGAGNQKRISTRNGRHARSRRTRRG